MASRLGLTAILLVVLLLAVAGCGGGDDDSTTAASPAATGTAGPNGGEPGSQAQGQRPEAPDEAGKGNRPGGESGKDGEDSPPGSGGGEAPDSSPSAGQPQPPGGASSEKPTVSPRKRFARTANAICSKRRKAMLSDLGKYLQGEASKASRREALTGVTRVVIVPSMEAQIRKIRRAGPPPGSVQKVNAFLAAWEEGIREARSGSRPLLGAYAEEVFGPAAELAVKAGLDKCTYS